MLTRGWIVPLCIGLTLGCGSDKKDDDKGSKEPPPGESKPSGTPTASAIDAGGTAKTPATKAPPEQKKPTKKQLKTFRQHLAEGRRLAKAGTYAEAIAMFDKAVEIEPGNARAWSELGFAHYKVDANDESIAASRMSMRLAKDPRVKAASGYNLGLAFEAADKRDRARAVYRDSLELRPNQTVLDRYRKVGGTTEVWAEQPTCGATPTNEKSLCDCFIAAAGELDEPEQTQCIPLYQPGDFFVFWVGPINTVRDRGWLDGYLGRKVGGELQLLARVVSDAWYGPKIIEDYELHTTEKTTAGGKTVWRIDGTYVRGDDEVMMFVETSKQRRTTFCIDDGTRPKCSIGFTTGGSWTATIGPHDIDDTDNHTWFKDEYGGKPPVSWEYSLDVTLGDDGTVTTKATKGLGSFSAAYALW
jgi:hypothetical protein